MPPQITARDEEIADQIEILAAEKEQLHREDTAPEPEPQLPELLEPLIFNLEALSRATAENTAALSRLESVAGQQEALPQLMGTIQESLDKRNGVNQRLFDSLHEELKGYKDGFLLEVMHKPLVRDLIMLFDDLSGLRRQFEELVNPELAASGERPPFQETGKNLANNLQHMLGSLLEVMARIDVIPIERRIGKLNKHTQRAVATEPAASEAEDRNVVLSVKQGFMWRDRVFRAEEVVIQKWTAGSSNELAKGGES